MSSKIILLPAAQKDIIEIKNWYRGKKIGLELEFVFELKAIINLLKENPLLFQTRYKSFRAAILKRFPYLIYYTIENEIILIHAVLAAKQDQDGNLKVK